MNVLRGQNRLVLGGSLHWIFHKHWKQDLNLHDNQLLRYFNVSKAKFGLLTNGIIYRFYTDLKEPNIMDDKPFLEVDITDLRDNQIEELKKFHKSYFDVDNILNSASELKYMGELKAIIQEEFSSPSTDFVKMFATKVYEGRMLQNIIDQFTPLVKRAISSHINDIINDRLKGALTVSDSKIEESQTKNSGNTSEETTEEVASGSWQQTDGNWWYQNADGTYPTSCWQEIDGQWYVFDENGYIRTGWYQEGDKWYYFQENGAMAHDTDVDGYHLGSDGVMQ